jgi:hypothetical protein
MGAKKCLICSLAVLMHGMVLFASPGYSIDVTLEWDPNTETDLDHYVVYWGTSSRNYTSTSDTIESNSTRYTVTNLTE